jgi:hypothetical protein
MRGQTSVSKPHFLALAVILVACPLPNLCAQTSDIIRMGLSPGEMRDSVRLLSEPVDMKDFLGPMTLSETLQLLMEKMAARDTSLAIVVNTDAFRKQQENLNIK